MTLAPIVRTPVRSIEDRVRLARRIALVVDFFQIIAAPLFIEGGASPMNDLLDVVTGFALIRLLGWHPAFLPTFFAELIPGFDLVPTWTLAVMVVSRARLKEANSSAS